MRQRISCDLKKINAVKNSNAGKKLRKPAVPTVNTNILKSNVTRPWTNSHTQGSEIRVDTKKTWQVFLGKLTLKNRQKTIPNLI